MHSPLSYSMPSGHTLTQLTSFNLNMSSLHVRQLSESGPSHVSQVESHCSQVRTPVFP